MKFPAVATVICFVSVYIIVVDGDAVNTEPLVVRGNNIYQSTSNKIWAGKGANLPDMRACGVGCERSVQEVTRRIDYLLDDMELDWVRFLLEAYDEGSTVTANETYWQYVKSVVNHIGSKPGKYVEVTLFSDPSVGADPKVPGGPSTYTKDRWVFMAEYFKDLTHVIIGVVNEPQGFQSTPGYDVSLRDSMNYVANKIRGTGATNLILVQCLAYSADCTLYAKNRIDAENVAYELHLYCTIDQANTKLSLELPFVASEMGIVNNIQKNIVEDYASFRYIVELCKIKGIPYAGWSFDENCAPVMLEGQTSNSNGCGEGNDLSMHSAWGKLFLEDVPCSNEFCDDASPPISQFDRAPVPSIDLAKFPTMSPTTGPSSAPEPTSQNVPSCCKLSTSVALLVYIFFIINIIAYHM